MNNEDKRQTRDLKISLATDTSEEYVPREAPIDFSKIKVGLKTLEDAVLIDSGDLKKANPMLADKQNVLKAIDTYNYEEMRAISDFFYKTNGIYSRLCKYAANLYRYDWMLSVYSNDKEQNNDKILNSFYNGLTILDNFNVKLFLGKVAMKVIRYGAYYGYKIKTDKHKVAIQELPPNYCRSRFEVNGKPAIEFNMRYFDETFKDTAQRIKIVKMFPLEFQKGYILYKEGKLPAEYMGDKSGWYLLDINSAFVFNNCGEEVPLFISVIPYLIDLDQAQDLDRKKMAQKLIKIIIQKLPIDKNGDLVFDVDEARDLHNNAVSMLQKAIGVDVLTTFADVQVEDLADTSAVTSIDELEKVERSVYNASGTAQNLFNTDGNIALEKSIRNDEASLANLILQFEVFLNGLIEDLNKNPKKLSLKVQLLTTTIYNYQELAKAYKDLASAGQCSRLLSPIALGQSQSSLLANAYFETQVLDLASLFIPPLTSNTLNSDALKTVKGEDEDSKPGRKEKADDEKSEKTIANQESMN